MEQARITVLSAGTGSATALVSIEMDGMHIGVEEVGALALALLVGQWRDAVDLVGRTFEREFTVQ